MAKESEKFDIEDIKDPLDAVDQESADVDLEDAVAEEPEEVEKVDPGEVLKSDTQKTEDEPQKENKEKSEPAVEDSEPVEKKDKKPKKEKDKKPFPWKTVAIIVITFLVTTALILGGFYLYEKYAPKEDAPAAQTTNSNNNVNVSVTKPATTQKTVYVTADPTLNLRKDPNTSGQVLATVPYGTQLTVLATQTTWYQVAYNNLTGWIDSTYTTTNNPLLYQNSDYRFQITFPTGWGGYKLFPIKADSTETASWYVALPTTQANYSEAGIDKGYASMFALTVYTPDQWKTVQSASGPKPTLAVQNSDYVIAYSLPNGIPPADLATQAAQTKDVVATIKFY